MAPRPVDLCRFGVIGEEALKEWEVDVPVAGLGLGSNQ